MGVESDITVTDPAGFVRLELSRLEADLRELALLALADWERLEIVSPDLFRAVASIQRPAWGHWNGLLTALREARKATLRTATEPVREKVKGAVTLETILEFLDRDAGPALAEAAKALAALVKFSMPRKPRVVQVLTLPISLRNITAHFAPSDPDWWAEAAQAMQPLAALRATGQLRPPLPSDIAHPAPWFHQAGGEVCALNGLRDDAVVYASPQGTPHYVAEMVGPMLLAFQRLLGKTELQEESLKRLLIKLSPENLKGVLLGDYLVGPPAGSGGYATVHVGTQLSTGRKVAVKILKDGMSEDARARFHQEAVFLSRLNHPHIVTILGHGEETWVAPRDPTLAQSLAQENWFQELARSAPIKSYIAMEWIEGHTLEEVFQGQREPRPEMRELAEWLLQCTEALSVVHAANLIHRDVKPGNLMVTDQGVVKVMDFGIARTRGALRTVVTTHDRQLGTRAYMAPEQLGAKDPDVEVGPACDVYGLSATFYELLTGKRLFGHDRETVQNVETKKLTGTQPERPLAIVPSLPWELDTILLGGLEPGVSERYHSMEELGRDVRHYLRDEPIEYRRPSAWRRLRLWYRRSPALARLVAAVALLLLTGIVGTTVAAVWINAARNDAVVEGNKAIVARNDAVAASKEAIVARNEALDSKNKADVAKDKAEENLYVADMNLASIAGRELNTPRMRDLLLRHYPRPGETDRRDWVWYVLWSAAQGELMTLAGHAGAVEAVAISHDGRLIATGSNDLTGRIWNAETGKLLHTLTQADTQERPFPGVRGIGFTPDDKQLVTAGSNGSVQLWDVTSGKWLRKTHVLDLIKSATLAPNGTLFALGGSREVATWDVATRKTHVFPKESADYQALAYSRRGAVLAVAYRYVNDEQGIAVKFFNPTTGEETAKPLPLGKSPINALALAPDRNVLAVAREGTVDLWDFPERKLLQTIGTGGRDISTVAFAPDGSFLATGDRDGRILIWPSTPERRYAFLTSLLGDAAVKALVFSDDGRRLVSAAGASVRVWDMALIQEMIRFAAPHRSVASLGAAFSRDGKLLATLGTDSLLVSDRAGKILLQQNRLGAFNGLSLSGLKNTAMAFSPEQKMFALAASAGAALGPALLGPKAVQTEILLWDFVTSKVHRGLRGQSEPIRSLAFSPDAALLAGGHEDGAIWLLKVGQASDAKIESDTLLGHTRCVSILAFSPDGKVLASHSDNRSRLSLAQRISSGNPEPTPADTSIRLWDPAAKKQLAKIDYEGQIGAMVFSPSGRLLATGDGNGHVAVWDVAKRRQQSAYGAHSDKVTALAFTADSRFLVSCSDDGTIKLFDVVRQRPMATIPEVYQNVAHILTGSQAAGPPPEMMPADGKPAPAPRDRAADAITRATAQVAAATVDSDQNLVTALSDSSVRIWPPASDKGTYEYFLRSATFDPTNPQRKRNLILACWNYGRQRQAAGDQAEARRLLTQGLELLGSLPAEVAGDGASTDLAKWKAEFESEIRSLGETPK